MRLPVVRRPVMSASVAVRRSKGGTVTDVDNGEQE